MESLLDEIKRHEGFQSWPYRCSAGKLTIGYGLNLDDGVSEPLAAKILEWTIDERRDTLERIFPFFKDLSPARQEVIINMAFNLGISRLLGFRKMILAAAAGDAAGVCREMRDSKWAMQVGRRADELIEKYRRG